MTDPTERKPAEPFELDGLYWCETCQQRLPREHFATYYIENKMRRCRACSALKQIYHMKAAAKKPYFLALRRLRRREYKKGRYISRKIGLEDIEALVKNDPKGRDIPHDEVHLACKDNSKPWSPENCLVMQKIYTRRD